MTSNGTRFAVLGTGNSAHAFAADIALKGYPVNLSDVPPYTSNLEAIRENGGIAVSGITGDAFAELNLVTADLQKAVEGVDIIILAAPGNAHEPYCRALAPYLSNGQYVVFVSNFGAIRFRHWMQEWGIQARAIPVETQSLIYATRSTKPGSVYIQAIKSALPAAALPAACTQEFLDRISCVFPQWIPAENTLCTSINNMNPVVHPPMTLLNTGRIEATLGQGWNLYREGATDSVARVMEAIDQERMALANLCDITSTSLAASFRLMYRDYELRSETISQMLRTSPVHANPDLAATPSSVHVRYVTEDVPFGLVPWSSMARMWGLSTPVVDAIIRIASVIEGVDYFAAGVTVTDMGIEGLSPAEVKALVT